jgi:serine/threonine-protein kinase
MASSPPSSTTPPFALTLFGSIDLRGPSADIEAVLVNNKAIGALAYLSVPTVGRFVRRDILTALLWPELDQSRARSALRKTLHLVRRAMDERAVLSRGDEEVALSAEIVWCDAAAFTAAADAGFLVQALQFFRGELMPGFHLPECAEFDRWLDEERRAARERAAAAAWALAKRFETTDQYSDAVGMARRAVRFSWTDERALRRALLMLERLGDRAGAVHLYEEFARRLKLELETEPSPETVELAARLKSAK